MYKREYIDKQVLANLASQLVPRGAERPGGGAELPGGDLPLNNNNNNNNDNIYNNENPPRGWLGIFVIPCVSRERHSRCPMANLGQR